MDKIIARKIKDLKSEIANLKEESLNLEKQLKDLDKTRKIDSLPGLILYEDRIVGKNRTISIHSNFIINIEKSGEIAYTTETSGGGARPTLTRVVTGAYLAGPLGAVIGGTAQKQKKIKTKTKEHDNRLLYITINSNEGNIDISLNPNLEPKARVFISNALNAKLDYPKHQKEIKDKKEILLDKIKKNNEANLIKIKEDELNDLLKSTGINVKNYNKKNNIQLWFIMSIVWSSLFFMPVVPLIFLIIALIKSCIIRKINKTDGKTIATIIISIFGIISNMFLYQSILLSPIPSTTDQEISNDYQLNNKENQNTQSETKEINKADDENITIKKCIVMEWYDIVTTGGSKDDAIEKSKVFCNNNLASWGIDEFNEAVNYDWENKKNKSINGKSLMELLDIINP